MIPLREQIFDDIWDQTAMQAWAKLPDWASHQVYGQVEIPVIIEIQYQIVNPIRSWILAPDR